MKMGKKYQIKWLDAWIENELTTEDVALLDNPQTVCTLVGFLMFEDDNTIALAAEKVIGMNKDISHRAVTFVPKCLIMETEEL